MKLCIITRFFPQDYVGGGEFFIYNIWKKARQKHTVSLITGWINNPQLLPKEAYKINLQSSNRFIRYFKFYFHIRTLLKKIQPDLIHTNTMEIPSTSIPTIVMVHHLGHLFDTRQKGIIEKLMLIFQRWLVKKRLENARIIATVSHATKSDILRLGIEKRKIKVIYPGIETDTLKPKNPKNKKFTITYPSRISPDKGQHIAIEAFKLLPEKIRKKSRLLLPGFTSDKRYLNKLNAMTGNEDINIITNVPKMNKYYENADIIIFPTLMFEGFGRVSVEGMCCEKPVIASDFPAIREVVKDYGILVKPNDAQELSKAIVILYSNLGLRKKMGKRGRRYVLANYTWKKVFANYNRLYDEVIRS